MSVNLGAGGRAVNPNNGVFWFFPYTQFFLSVFQDIWGCLPEAAVVWRIPRLAREASWFWSTGGGGAARISFREQHWRPCEGVLGHRTHLGSR